MKIKLTLQRQGRANIDLAVSMDSTATVGDLAEQLLVRDPEQRTQADSQRALTLALVNRDNQLLDRTSPIADTNLQSGDTVSLLPAGETFRVARDDSFGELVVLDGPHAGQKFPLQSGSNVVGRDQSCHIPLSNDPLVSRRHARINVTDLIEIFDLGSANGTLVEGTAMPRAILRPNDIVQVGDTKFRVRSIGPISSSQAADIGQVNHVRSPVIADNYLGQEVEFPQAPEQPRRQRFPLAPMFAPILMGAIMYAVTRNPLSLLFIALTPIMLIGSFLEGRRVARLDYADLVAAYDRELVQLRDSLLVLRDLEISKRASEHLSCEILIGEADRLGPSLWSRRVDKPGFGVLRVGLGPQPTRNSHKLPSSSKSPRDQVIKATDLSHEFANVAPVPITFSLTESAIGVAGPRSLSLPVARSLVMQAVTLHSPAEVVLGGFFSGESAKDWDWLKWLPHTSSAHSPLKTRTLASNAAASTALADEIESLIATRTDHRPTWQNPAVLLLVEADPSIEHSRLVEIAEHGPAAGVYVIWVANAVVALPAACKAFVELETTNSSASAGYVSVETSVSPIVVDELDPQRAAQTARHLAGVTDIGAPIVDVSDIPRQLSLLAALEDEDVANSQRVLNRWKESSSIVSGPQASTSGVGGALNLRAVLGQSAQGKHIIDLRADGPHALIGGTTGSGKSELLRSWILSLAANHSPQRVNFLFVDYKGGSAFDEFRDLPHSLGVVSNLGTHLVDRALTSLRAELTYRMTLFLSHGAKDLDEMNAKAPALTPPSLVIVVDEFAALVKEIPDFVDGMVDVGQRGRSLGLHLILATQQPKGVIKDNLRANTNLRIALRMADTDDSNDVLGSPEAALFDGELRGRAISKSGPTRLVQFQSAYSGAISSAGAIEPEIDIETLNITSPETWAPKQRDKVDVGTADTDLKRLLQAVAGAAALAELPKPRQAWLPELPAVLNLQNSEHLPLTVSDNQIYFARRDAPESQSQPPVAYDPDDGNVVIIGTSGSGKSTALRVIALGCALAARKNPIHVYVLDYAGMSLSGLEVLPNVGSVVSGNDDERVQRVLKMLRAFIDERTDRYRDVSADSIQSYRRLANRPEEPRIVLLIDGLSQMRAAYEGTDGQKWLDLLASIMADGRSRGVHVVLAADQRNALTSSMSSSVQRRLVMRMPLADDYSMLGVPINVLSSDSVPGRALEGRDELQIATVCRAGGRSMSRDEVTLAEQDEEIRRIAEFLSHERISPAPEVRRLPMSLTRKDLPMPRGSIVLGLESESLNALDISPSSPFLVTGPSGSGRSTLMTHLATECKRVLPRAMFHLLAQRRSPLHELVWDSSCSLPEDAASWAEAVSRALDSGIERHVLFIDSADYFLNTAADYAVEPLIRRLVNDDHFVVVEGEPTTLSRDVGFVKLVRGERRGVVMQPETEHGSSIFGIRFPRINPQDFPPGRGILVERRSLAVVQTPLPQDWMGKPAH